MRSRKGYHSRYWGKAPPNSSHQVATTVAARPFSFDAFFSHDWGISPYLHHQFVKKIAASLQQLAGLKVWLDDEPQLNSSSGESTLQGIKSSSCFVVFLTEEYNKRISNVPVDELYCELAYASQVCDRKILVICDESIRDRHKWSPRVLEEFEGSNSIVDFSTMNDESVIASKLVPLILEQIGQPKSIDSLRAESFEDSGRVTIIPPTQRDEKLKLSFDTDGVKLSYLRGLLGQEEIKSEQKSIKEVATEIQNKTKDSNCSLCKLLAQENQEWVGRSIAYVSFTGEMNYRDFIDALDSQFQNSDPYLWVSFACNNLNQQSELDDDQWLNVIKTGIAILKTTVFVFDEKALNSWRYWELFCAFDTSSVLQIVFTEVQKKFLLQSSMRHTINSENIGDSKIRNAIAESISFESLNSMIVHAIDREIEEIQKGKGIEPERLTEEFLTHSSIISLDAMDKGIEEKVKGGDMERRTKDRSSSDSRNNRWMWKKEVNALIVCFENDVIIRKQEINKSKMIELTETDFKDKLSVAYKKCLLSILYRFNLIDISDMNGFIEPLLFNDFKSGALSFLEYKMEIFRRRVTVFEFLWIRFDECMYTVKLRQDVLAVLLEVANSNTTSLRDFNADSFPSLKQTLLDVKEADQDSLVKNFVQFLSPEQIKNESKDLFKLKSNHPQFYSLLKDSDVLVTNPKLTATFQNRTELIDALKSIDLKALSDQITKEKMTLFQKSSILYNNLKLFKEEMRKGFSDQDTPTDRKQSINQDYLIAISKIMRNLNRLFREYPPQNDDRVTFKAQTLQSEEKWNAEAYKLLQGFDTYIKDEGINMKLLNVQPQMKNENRLKMLETFGNRGLLLSRSVPKSNLSIAYSLIIRTHYFSILEKAFTSNTFKDLLNHCDLVIDSIDHENPDDYELSTVRQLLTVLELLSIEMNDNLNFSNEELAKAMVAIFDRNKTLRNKAEAIKTRLGNKYGTDDDPSYYIELIDRVSLRYHLTRGDDESLNGFDWKRHSTVDDEKQKKQLTQIKYHLDQQMREHLEDRKRIAKFVRRAYVSTDTGGLFDMLSELNYRVQVVDLDDFENGVIIAIGRKTLARATEDFHLRVFEYADVIVILRGSNGLNWNDWQINLDIGDHGKWRIDAENEINGVHAGFATRGKKLFQKINYHINDMLKDLLEAAEVPTFKVSFTFAGHSQGAGLALLLGLKYNQQFPYHPNNPQSKENNYEIYKTTKVWTFAFPGAFKNASVMDTLFVRHCNMNVYDDIIPKFGDLTGFKQTANPNNFFKQELPESLKEDLIAPHSPFTYDAMMQTICNSQSISEYLITLRKKNKKQVDWEKNMNIVENKWYLRWGIKGFQNLPTIFTSLARGAISVAPTVGYLSSFVPSWPSWPSWLSWRKKRTETED